MAPSYLKNSVAALVLFVSQGTSAQIPQPVETGIGPAMREKLRDAGPNELRIFVTGSLLLPLEAIRQEAQQAVGLPLRIEYGSARGNLKAQIAKGEAFDVAILLPDVIVDPAVASKIFPHQYPIATIPIAIGLRGDAATPAVDTLPALRTALLNAQSVKYAPTGAARDTVDRVLSSLGIASRIKDSSAIRDRVELAPGEYEIDLYPISEILENRELKNLGLVPAPLQVPAKINAVIAKGGNVKAAKSLVRFLAGPAIDQALRSKGIAKGR